MPEDYVWPTAHRLDEVPFGDLVGKIVESLVQHTDALVLRTTDGSRYVLLHYPECCESVELIDVAGDLNDLIGKPITRCEQRTSHDPPPGGISSEGPHYEYDSWTWSFNEIATNKGSVTLRWFGQSNGYYSETAALHVMERRAWLN